MAGAKFRAKMRTANKGRKLKQLRKPTGSGRQVKIGLIDGAAPYPDGTSVIDVGKWLEFGTQHISEKAWFRNALKAGVDERNNLNRRSLRKIRNGQLTVDQALGRLGAQVVGDVQGQIDKQGHVDTGHLKQSVTYQVQE